MAILSEAARTFLEEKRFAVLATLNRDGSVQQTTMWYLLEDETILMNTLAGRLKDRNLRRDGRISLCVEDGYRYLTISGQVEIIDDPEIAQRDIHRLSARYHGESQEAQQMDTRFSKEQRVTLRLKVEHIHEYL
jgi:PPOX class probable F420-dependent enzyme